MNFDLNADYSNLSQAEIENFLIQILVAKKWVKIIRSRGSLYPVYEHDEWSAPLLNKLLKRSPFKGVQLTVEYDPEPVGHYALYNMIEPAYFFELKSALKAKIFPPGSLPIEDRDASSKKKVVTYE